MTPTPEQEAIISAVRDTSENLMISAYAGTGKTTTLTMIADSIPESKGLALAFNVKIKKELEKRFPANFEVKTLNGLGHIAWCRAINRRCEVDQNKLSRLMKNEFKRINRAWDSEEWTQVRTLIVKAQLNGLVPNKFPYKSLVPDDLESWQDLAVDFIPDSTTVEIARDILIASIRESFGSREKNAIISFDDQIYMSCLFNGVFSRYPVVLVDESQDLSPLNHIQIKRSAAGRIIAVGDSRQAIYAFRGADSNSMQNLRLLRLNWIDLPLSTTFRCPKDVVARQLYHAPGYTAFHTNLNGSVEILSGKSEEVVEWNFDSLSISSSTAVLCRNNAPLLSLAFKLIRNGISCSMIGRDIGKGLISLSKKLLPSDEIPVQQCSNIISEWLANETALAIANNLENKIESITDRADCLSAVLFSGGVKTSGQLRLQLERLFSKENERIELSSIHRAKGLEWETVILLDPWRIPSKYARSKSALEQEFNLRYVAETRTKNRLILADLDGWKE